MRIQPTSVCRPSVRFGEKVRTTEAIYVEGRQTAKEYLTKLLSILRQEKASTRGGDTVVLPDAAGVEFTVRHDASKAQTIIDNNRNVSNVFPMTLNWRSAAVTDDKPGLHDPARSIASVQPSRSDIPYPAYNDGDVLHWANALFLETRKLLQPDESISAS